MPTMVVMDSWAISKAEPRDGRLKSPKLIIISTNTIVLKYGNIMYNVIMYILQYNALQK